MSGARTYAAARWIVVATVEVRQNKHRSPNHQF